MTERPTLRTVLKRGALITAANWQLVVLQFVAESMFKVLLALPVAGGAFLFVLIAGGDVMELLGGDLRDTLSATAGALNDHPAALAAFLAAFGIVLLGGSALMFLVKGGTVAILIAGDNASGSIERSPVRLAGIRRASVFSLDRLMAGCAAYFRRYLKLGLVLMATYAVSAAGYLLILLGGYRLVGDRALLLGWTIVAALSSSALVVWITIVNFLYLLTQIVIAADNLETRAAMARVYRFLRADLREVLGVFANVLLLIVLAMAVSLLATAGVGLIAFVPLVWLAAVPLQAAAWLLRGLVFEYLGLMALVAYLTLYRSFARADPVRANGPAGWPPPAMSQTA